MERRYQHCYSEKTWTGATTAPPGAGELIDGAGLRWEGPADLTLVLADAAGAAATASCRGKVIKGVAVRPDLRGTGTGREIVGRMIARQRTRGIMHSLVFTSPGAAPFFAEIGFREAGRAEPWTVLLEAGFGSFQRYLDRLRRAVPPGAVAALTTAALASQRLRALLAPATPGAALLVLAGEAATAPPLPGLVCLKGEDYFHPFPFFPSYYLPDPAQAGPAWAHLQARLFLKMAAVLSLAAVFLFTGAETYNRHARPLFRAAGLTCLEEEPL